MVPDLFANTTGGHVRGVAKKYGAVVTDWLVGQFTFRETLCWYWLLATLNHFVNLLNCQSKVCRLH
jgi:hypothetical protein